MSSRVPYCNVCRVRQAEYVCSECGNLVCRYDFDPYLRVCSECLKGREMGVRVEYEAYTPLKWFLLIFLGFVLITIGFLLWGIGLSGAIQGESFIVIAPFPFIFFGRVGIEIAILILIIFLIFIYLLFRYFRFSIPSGPS